VTRGGARARAAAIAVAAAVVLSSAACAPQAASPEVSLATGGLPDGVTAEFQQGRSDVAARQAQVVISNGTDETLVIGDVQIDDVRFAAPATRVEDRDSTIGPGRTAGIRVQLPDMACDEELDPDAAIRPSVLVEFTLGEAPGVASAPIDDPLDVLGPLHVRDCRAAAVAAAAHVSFADFDPSPAGHPATLVLAVAPTGRASVLLAGIQTTNLLTFGAVADAAVETYPIGMAVREDSAGYTEIHLPILPLRCDAHAVQEDKRGTIFDVEVEIDGEAGEIELAASEDIRGQILTWVADWCGFGG
jgi:hypothetical protein